MALHHFTNYEMKQEEAMKIANDALEQVTKNNLTEYDIAIYVRVSSEEQAEKQLGIPYQISACQEFIKANPVFKGKKVRITIYKDEGYSADKYLLHERPAMNQIIKDAQAGKINYVITFRGDRIARKTQDDSWFRNTTEKLGVRVYTANDGQLYNDASPSNMLLRGMMALVAEYEVAITKERILATKAYQKREKLFSGGDIPYGYRWIKEDENGKPLEREQRHIVKVDEEISVYLAIKDKYMIDNMGTVAIADWLNENGYTNQNGTKFKKDHVRHILRNPFYAGFFPTNVVNRGRDIDGKKFTRRNPIEEWELIESPLIPTVIDKEEWNAIIEKMQGRRTTTMKPKEITTDWLLTGLIKCTCGETWTIRDSGKRKGGKHYKYYACKNKNCKRDVKSLSKEDFENKVIAKFKNEVLKQANEKEMFTIATEHIKEAMNVISADANEIIVELNSLKNKRKQYHDARFNPKQGDKPLSNELFEMFWETNEKLIKEKEEALSNLNEEKRLKEKEQEEMNITLNAITLLFKSLDPSQDLGMTEKRTLLLTCIESININEVEKIFIKYREDMNNIPVHLKSRIKNDINESLASVFEKVENEVSATLEDGVEDEDMNLLGVTSEQRHTLHRISQHEYFTKNAISAFFTNMNNSTSN